jgi:hypothetical protein
MIVEFGEFVVMELAFNVCGVVEGEEGVLFQHGGDGDRSEEVEGVEHRWVMVINLRKWRGWSTGG